MILLPRNFFLFKIRWHLWFFSLKTSICYQWLSSSVWIGRNLITDPYNRSHLCQQILYPFSFGLLNLRDKEEGRDGKQFWSQIKENHFFYYYSSFSLRRGFQSSRRTNRHYRLHTCLPTILRRSVFVVYFLTSEVLDGIEVPMSVKNSGYLKRSGRHLYCKWDGGRGARLPHTTPVYYGPRWEDTPLFT